MTFKKIGRIFKANKQYNWMYSHTAMPIPLKLSKHKYRIFFGTRDKYGSPSIGYIDINMKNPLKILNISKEPVLKKGSKGYFDDNGVYPGSIIKMGNELWMYYSGRSNGEAPLYYMSIGLAISKDGGHTWKKKFKAPVLGRSENNPWMVSTPHVIYNKNTLIMYYLSGIEWDSKDLNKSYYNIKEAYSKDGINWKESSHFCFPFIKKENAISSPTIYKDVMVFSALVEKEYKLSFSKRKNNTWRRKKYIQILSKSKDLSWDNISKSYPHIFEYNNNLYLLYSGNNLGKEGIGIAKYI